MSEYQYYEFRAIDRPLGEADRQALRALWKPPRPGSAIAPRSAGELRARADAIRETRERKQSERQEAERKRRGAKQERARRARLDVIMQRGEAAWHEVETEIERRNAYGYDTAAALLLDLKAIAKRLKAIG
ncbi:hypothetical protein EJ066_05500 [Mesorhizobium sp. M9A.F.Ca.ET.002.03.1.2]|uniref:hypothetical protein n=1 Tax=Mesorhizobium sp. M9A.F.Ca.ET.002.03.1.2 TaxID=2493668 RepID=UPI000F752314|nr:hypothetical protein [Mesorhizobium sp. M9A.F.Ca.ET.002.03.1.2]AZN96787.1 hypothetical protein EJ066_05500 [Mesorhizobium sp. M9A.F.Ca.ET.002.03.1.2]